MGSPTCCHQLVLDCQRKEEVCFVATSLCSKMGRSSICCHQFLLKDGKKYDLLPPVCGARLSKMGGSTICCHQFVLDCQRWEEVRFFATSLCAKMGRSTICCHQFVLDCQRWEEVRFVATSLCPSVKDGKKYDLLPPVCGARLSKM